MSPKAKYDAKFLAAKMKEAGFHPSLPAGLFSTQGDLLWANERMQKLLGDKIRCPMSAPDMENIWPFSNEDKAGPALFAQLLLGDKLKDQAARGAAGLKTFKLCTVRLKGEKLRLCVAELQRSGDLLSDRDSRQTLFRSVSHEVRTSVMALQGYLKMLKVDASQAEILERMGVSVKRLEKVVDRLKDFQSEIEK